MYFPVLAGMLAAEVEDTVEAVVEIVDVVAVVAPGMAGRVVPFLI